MAYINGWGRGTWGQLEWGEAAVPVILPSPGAGTSALGTILVDAETNVSLTGVSGTSAVGSLSVVAKANITPATQLGTSALGTAIADAEANVVAPSLVGTTGAPQAGVNAQAIASVPGLVGSVGALSIEIDGEANVTISGVAATSALGTSTTKTDNRFTVTLNAALANLGNLVIIAEATIITDSLLATTNTPFVNVWSSVNDSQSPNWKDVAA